MAKYITNKELIAQFRNIEHDPNTFYKSVQTISNRLLRSVKYKGYHPDVKDEMTQMAMVNAFKYVNNFDLERGTSLFSYITQLCINAYKGVLGTSRKHSMIKYGIIHSMGSDEYDFSDEINNDIVRTASSAVYDYEQYKEEQKIKQKQNKIKD